jgi:hypothetical protein
MQTPHITFGRTLIALLTLPAAISLQAGTLIYEFTFDDPLNGTSTASTGALGGSGAFINNSSMPVNLHGADKSGVSGKSGDYAFDNTSSTAGGTPSNVMTFNGEVFTGGLTSFTVAGWFNVGVSTVYSQGGRILAAPNLTMRFQSSGVAIKLGTNDEFSVTTASYSNLGMHILDEWIFFAVTYDNTEGLLTLYTGNKTTGSLNEIMSIAQTKSVSSSTTDISIGNSKTAWNRAITGLMDNYRIWAPDSTDPAAKSTGALSQAALQSIMTADIAGPGVPEPATTVALLGTAVLLGAVLRKTQKH